MLTLWSWLAACQQAPTPERHEAQGACGQASVQVSGEVGTAVVVDVPAATGTVRVRLVSRGDVAEAAPVEVEDPPSPIQVVIGGLVAGEAYHWTVEAWQDDGSVARCGTGQLVLPPARHPLTVAISEPGSEVATGFLLFSTLDVAGGDVVVVDGTGAVRFERASSSPDLQIRRARVDPVGGLAWLEQDATVPGGARSALVFQALDGTNRHLVSTPGAHHDFLLQPDRLLWIRNDIAAWPMPADGGPSDYASRCPYGQCPMAGEAIRSLSVDGVQPQDLFDTWVAGLAPIWGCDHTTTWMSALNAYDGSHASSLAWTDEDRTLYVLGTFDDTLYAIDGDTGALRWRLGGPASDFVLVAGAWWDHGYLSDVWPGGFLVWETGWHRGWARISEYAFDEGTGEVRQISVVEDPGMSADGVLGNAERLPGGNRLLTWPQHRLVQEVTPEGLLVWEALGSGDAYLTRATFVPDLEAARGP